MDTYWNVWDPRLAMVQLLATAENKERNTDIQKIIYSNWIDLSWIWYNHGVCSEVLHTLSLV
jgi:hypothetical protein